MRTPRRPGATGGIDLTTCAYAGATNDPDTALGDETYSGGVGTLKAGTHSITIIVTTAPYPNGGAYIQIDKKQEIFGIQSVQGGNRNVARKKFFG